MMSRPTAYRARSRLQEKLEGTALITQAIVVEQPTAGDHVVLGIILNGSEEAGFTGALYLAQNPHYAYKLTDLDIGTPIIDLH